MEETNDDSYLIMWEWVTENSKLGRLDTPLLE